jgi:hypothetical protein
MTLMQGPLWDPNFLANAGQINGAAAGSFGGFNPGASAGSMGMAMPGGATPSFLGLKGVSTAQGLSGILQGVNTLGNLWGALQSLKLAKKQFNFTKDITETNLRNQTQSYNTALSDRISSRAHQQGMSADQAKSWLATHSLAQRPKG